MLQVSVAVLMLLNTIPCLSLPTTTSQAATQQEESGSTSQESSTLGTGSGTSEGSTACSPNEIFNINELYPYTDKFALAPMDIKKDTFPTPPIPNCHDPKNVDPVNSEPNSLASCPWVYVINYNPLRIPQVIKEARCLQCQDCGYGDPREKLMTSCKNITHQMKVWKKDSFENGHQMYRMETIDITVACVCARHT